MPGERPERPDGMRTHGTRGELRSILLTALTSIDEGTHRMNRHIRSLSWLVLVLGLSLPGIARRAGEEWVSLFNGKT